MCDEEGAKALLSDTGEAGHTGSDQFAPTETTWDVVIVGAGFAGLYMLHKCRQLGLRTRLLEAGGGVGGTWYWNRYPGARCDADSIFYSYSFDTELDQEWTWTERCASQAEILRYLEHVTDRFELRGDISLDTCVTAAVYNDDCATWTVSTEPGETYTTRFCVMATGCLSDAKKPDIPGLDDFRGASYYTSRWPHQPVDLTGKTVAVIGTGSSGVQCVPQVAQVSQHVYVFQRTANFVLQAQNHPLTAEHVADIKADYPAWRERARNTRGGMPVQPPTHSALDVSDEERLARLEAGWERGGLGCLTNTFDDVSTNQVANNYVAAFVRDKIRTIVHDPTTADSLTPRGFPFGAKRTPVGTKYLDVFNRPDVTLVDLALSPINRITPTGISTQKAEYDVDVIVYATGFDAFTGPLLRMNVQGSAGCSLREAWADGAAAYLGLQVAGFPNLFLITGPGSPSVLGNVVVCIEQHVEWIAATLAEMIRRDADTISATKEAQERWMAHVADAAERSLISKGPSWYSGANVEGKPRVFLPYVPGIGVFRTICDEIVADDYRGFTIEATARTPGQLV